jgi:uncharacterized protein YndB with AHSA1/START domain
MRLPPPVSGRDGAPPSGRSARGELIGRPVRRAQAGYPGWMAVMNVLIDRDPRQVWEVLSDGWAYAQWVAGTRHIRDADAHWPEPGAQIHYTFGIGPLTIEDVTTVRHVEPRRRLELEAYAGRLGSARISIELLSWGEDRTVVIIDEHPLTGMGARWHSLPLDAMLRLRNRRMMRSLAKVVRARHHP